MAGGTQGNHLLGVEREPREDGRPRLPLPAVGPTVVLELPGDKTGPTGPVHQFTSFPPQSFGGSQGLGELD
jgi:hypothetical protein